MNSELREIGTYSLIALGTVVVHATVLLGLGVGPGALVVGLFFVALAAAVFVPAGGRPVAAVVGTLAVVVAGAAVPVYAARAVRPGSTLALSVGLAGLVLLLGVAVVRVTAFRDRPIRPV